MGELPNTAIARIRMPVSHICSTRNLINKLLKYEKVIEQPNSMTFLPDLVRAIDWLIQTDKQGIYHIVNPEPMTHSQILEEYRKYKPEHKYKKITAEELDQIVTAPRSNCILNIDKLTGEGFKMTSAFESLQETMKEYIKGI